MVNSPDSMIPRSYHIHNEAKPFYGLQHSERCISYLTTHPGFLLCLSLLVVFLPHWLAFCTLSTSSSSWFGDPCTCSSFCLVCFFLVSFHSIDLYSGFCWKHSLEDSAVYIMPHRIHRILTILPHLLPLEH